jgi:hypothetical protein
MNPTQISAQFAAYTWFLHGNAERPAAKEDALEFARDHWATFLPCAHKGLGRLLFRLAGPRRTQHGRITRKIRRLGRASAPRLSPEGAAAG